jgi:signal transduction histidine kinase
MADRARRAGRDVAADVAWVVLSAAIGALLLILNSGASGTGVLPGPHALAVGVDAGIGAAASAALWLRRRWPAGIALAILPVFVVSLSAGGAGLLALFNVGIRRQARVALAVAGLYQVAFIGYYLLWYRRYPFWIAWPWALTEFAALVAWGMYIRARRQLVASLRDRAEQAEAAQQLLAGQARQAERARIAGEMHDVLGHRVSLIALHAGGLQVRPDLPPEQVRETAGLIWSTAREALEELRGIIGVLRDGDGTQAGVPSAPQPSLRDIAPLVEESRRAGMNVTLDMQVEEPDTAPGALGRDACRIVREALTNVSKHARGTAVTVSVSGRAGSGLLVTIRNRLPIGQSAGEPLPGAGLGLVGLAERVSLSGGTFTHGPSPDGDFVVNAALRWQQ